MPPCFNSKILIRGYKIKLLVYCWYTVGDVFGLFYETFLAVQTAGRRMYIKSLSTALAGPRMGDEKHFSRQVSIQRKRNTITKTHLAATRPPDLNKVGYIWIYIHITYMILYIHDITLDDDKVWSGAGQRLVNGQCYLFRLTSSFWQRTHASLKCFSCTCSNSAQNFGREFMQPTSVCFLCETLHYGDKRQAKHQF